MSSKRIIKQGVYATLFLTIITLIVIGCALLIAEPKNPSVVIEKPKTTYSPIVVEHVDVINHQNSLDVVARLKNPNHKAGVSKYPVNVVVFGQDGNEIARTTKETYILPGEMRYLLVLDIPIKDTVGSVNIELPANPEFINIPDSLHLPSFNSFLQERSIKTIGSKNIEQQKGIVTNNSTLDFQKVEVAILALNSEGKIIGAGDTFLGNLVVGEQREFTIQWPEPTSKTERVIILPATNIFKEDNVLKIIGNPSLLR